MPSIFPPSIRTVVDRSSFHQFVSGFKQVLEDTKAAVYEKASTWAGSTPCDVFGVSIEEGGTVDRLQDLSCLHFRLADRAIEQFEVHFVPLAEKGLLSPPGTLKNVEGTPYGRQQFLDNAISYLDAVMEETKRLNKWANTSYLNTLLDGFYASFLQMVDKVIDAAAAVGERIVKRVTSSYWGWLGIGALVFVGYLWLKEGR